MNRDEAENFCKNQNLSIVKIWSKLDEEKVVNFTKQNLKPHYFMFYPKMEEQRQPVTKNWISVKKGKKSKPYDFTPIFLHQKKIFFFANFFTPKSIFITNFFTPLYLYFFQQFSKNDKNFL